MANDLQYSKVFDLNVMFYLSVCLEFPSHEHSSTHQGLVWDQCSYRCVCGDH